jgi:photosystem II stability/assembly factor-like uncharacterized protein
MQRNLKILLQVLAITGFIFFSSKEANSPRSSPPPQQKDTLGTGWQKIKVNNSQGRGPVTGLYFLNPSTGWYAGLDLYKTINAGASFTVQTDLTFPGCYAIQFVDSLHGWATGAAQNLLHTTDGGLSWEILMAGMGGGGDISFFDANNSYILYGNALHTTTDGGCTHPCMCFL